MPLPKPTMRFSPCSTGCVNVRPSMEEMVTVVASGGDYKDSSVVGIRSQRCAHVAVDRGSCRSNYVVNAVYGVVAAVLELKVVCLRAAGVAEDDVGRHVGSVDGACECPFPNQVSVCSFAHHSGALSRPFCACAAGEVGVCSAAPAPNAYFLV